MPVELKVPPIGESITEVQLGDWLKKEGDWADKDETLVEIESDKATVELPAPVAGVVSRLLKQEGDSAQVGEVIGYMEESPREQAEAPETKARPEKVSDQQKRQAARELREPSVGDRRGPSIAETAAERARAEQEKPSRGRPGETTRVMPAARRELAAHELEAEQVEPTGPGGRLLKEDVQRHVTQRAEERRPAPREAEPGRQEEVIPMTPIRRRIAERLVEAQQTAALLTTFNEVDMSAVIALRQSHQEAFQQRYQVKLGFMSFFVKASIDALKLFPAVNAEIRGTDIVYRNYYDIGIAVSSPKGLVVPVLRNAERASFAEIELAIADFARRARDNKIRLDELQGGTFTISNGGVFGSLLSTPIVNPPQSGILGLHAIQERPVARSGQVVIRPMMYVALTYDHRMVDGREAVTFLRRIKEVVEDPSRMLIEV